jgi:hypothetical protein
MSDFRFTYEGRTRRIETTKEAGTIAKFQDLRGVDCIVRTGDADQETIWVGCEKAELPMPFVNPQIHLNKEKAADLIPVLQGFVEDTNSSTALDYADGETTVIIPGRGSRKGLPPLKVVNHQPAAPTKPPTIPALEQAEAINDTRKIIDRLTSNRLQKAFVYLLGTLSGICVGSWTPSEAIAKAAVRFKLTREEALRLRRMYGISDNCGTSMR